ncbi:CMP-N,N'-diacetyllegionaminic acid synthase [Lachnospiraceae bacterium]|nr:CMP-N,N'-diacetyllegionaminic acid synthase [Lachnospiraceae bacterium]
MSAIAIITARGGSKRIPKKNIRDFCGKPMIAYSIEAALESGIFETVMVSTDSGEIAETARKYGADVPFLRSEKNSDDYADTTDVLMEVLEEYQKRDRRFEEFCCIYPTAPFVTAEKLKRSYEMLQQPEVCNVVPMVSFSFPPQRGMVKREGYLLPAYPEYIDDRSQDLEEILHDCGQFYWCKTDAFYENPNILFHKTVPFPVSEMEAQDIDNESDWELAELKFRYMNKKRCD